MQREILCIQNEKAKKSSPGGGGFSLQRTKGGKIKLYFKNRKEN